MKHKAHYADNFYKLLFKLLIFFRQKIRNKPQFYRLELDIFLICSFRIRCEYNTLAIPSRAADGLELETPDFMDLD